MSEAENRRRIEADAAEMYSLFTARPDWEPIADDYWEYEQSFSGAFVMNKRYPRDQDIGLDFLYAIVEKPGFVTISSCGVRGGCADHVTRQFDVPVDRPEVLKAVLQRYEKAARSINVLKVCQCVIVGSCSETELLDPLR